MNYIKLKPLSKHTVEVVNKKIATYKIKNSNFKLFIDKISALGEVFIIGGFIRDICLHRKPKDIDIIIDTSIEKLKKVIENYDTETNSQNGFKVHFDNISVDVWTLDSHFEKYNNPKFKKNLYSISKSTILNINSAVINLSRNKIYDRYYNSGIHGQKYIIGFNAGKPSMLKKPYLEKYIQKSIRLGTSGKIKISNQISEFLQS